MNNKGKKSRRVRRHPIAQSEATKGKISKSVNRKRVGQCAIENEGNLVVKINVLEGGKLILNSSTKVCNLCD